MKYSYNDYRKKWRRARRNYIHEKLGGVCARCGTIDNLEIHHKDNKKRGSSRGHDKRYKEYLELIHAGKKDALELLCRNCHKEHHRVLNLIKNRKD